MQVAEEWLMHIATEVEEKPDDLDEEPELALTQDEV